MTVRAVDRHPERKEPGPGVAAVEGMDRLDALLAASDFAVIAAPQTPETIGLFDASRLARMRPTGYLINIGRGAIVVLDDLVAALRAGRIAGAALDVFEVEPLPPDHPLWDFPNVIITPHTAGYSPVIADRHRATLVENVRRFARGEPSDQRGRQDALVLGPHPPRAWTAVTLCHPRGCGVREIRARRCRDRRIPRWCFGLVRLFRHGEVVMGEESPF